MKRRITRSIVPNLLTLVNLFAGFTAITYISKNDYYGAAIFILVAAIFDMLDGVIARLVHSSSEFGAELDSLCDAVSFGVAPSYMLYNIYFIGMGEIGILLASLPALGGAVRLARFNVKLISFEDKMYFTGLPIPASALTIISYIIFYHQHNLLPEQFKPVAIIFVTLLTSLVMVSTIRYDNLPRPSIRAFKQRPVVFIFVITGIISAVITKGYSIFPFMMLYILGTIFRELISWLKDTLEPEDEIDETEITEPKVFDL
jgi:CDP-diacylglycerol---serine O-phosphatidyltransferase